MAAAGESVVVGIGPVRADGVAPDDACQVRSCQERATQVRDGKVRAGQVRIGQVRASQVRADQDRVLAQKPEAQGCVWVRKDKSGVFPTSSQEALPAQKPETPGRKTSGGDPPDTLFTPSHVEGSSWGVLLPGLDAQKSEKK